MRVTGLRYLLLSFLVIPMVAIGCANGTGDGTSKEEASKEPPEQDEPALSGRLALVGLRTTDSAAIATLPIVDGMLAQAFDSVEAIDYVDIATTNLGTVDATEVSEIVAAHDLDLVASVGVARFGSVVGVSVQYVDGESGKVRERLQTFSFIRYRDREESLLFGPALYEAIFRQALQVAGRVSGSLPDGRVIVAGARPLVIGAMEIPADTTLGRIHENRNKIAQDAIRALADFGAVKFNEFVVFDHESRSRLYNVVGLDQVNDIVPVGNLEREALYNVNVPYFLSGSITASGSDSLRVEVRMHEVTGPTTDEVRASSSRSYELSLFQTSTAVRDIIAEILVVAGETLQKGADVVQGYSEGEQ